MTPKKSSWCGIKLDRDLARLSILLEWRPRCGMELDRDLARLVSFNVVPKKLSRCGMELDRDLARLVTFNLVRMTPKDLLRCDMKPWQGSCKPDTFQSCKIFLCEPAKESKDSWQDSGKTWSWQDMPFLEKAACKNLQSVFDRACPVQYGNLIVKMDLRWDWWHTDSNENLLSHTQLEGTASLMASWNDRENDWFHYASYHIKLFVLRERSHKCQGCTHQCCISCDKTYHQVMKIQLFRSPTHLNRSTTSNSLSCTWKSKAISKCISVYNTIIVNIMQQYYGCIYHPQSR